MYIQVYLDDLLGWLMLTQMPNTCVFNCDVLVISKPSKYPMILWVGCIST